MGLTLENHVQVRRFWQFLPALAVAAVILAFLGPAMDHHFAERQHDHSHVYLTSSAASHGHPELHPFEETHSHAALSPDDERQTGILYQPSDERSEDSSSVAVAVLHDGVKQVGPGDPFARAVSGDDSPKLEALVPPLKKPPRA